MVEVTYALAFVSVLLIASSIAIWLNWLRGPLLQRLDGGRAANAAPAAWAIKMLVVAFGISALAGVLAIGGWMFG
jgi:hypothetical protein